MLRRLTILANTEIAIKLCRVYLFYHKLVYLSNPNLLTNVDEKCDRKTEFGQTGNDFKRVK